MNWVDKPQNYKGLYGILQLWQGSHLDNFSPETLKLGWVASQSSVVSTMGHGIIFCHYQDRKTTQDKKQSKLVRL